MDDHSHLVRSGKYGAVGLDEHSLLFDERRNSRGHMDVRNRGFLHVLCSLGQWFDEKYHAYVQLTDQQSMAELASIAPTAGGQYRTCVDCPTNEPRRLTERRLGVRVCAARVKFPMSHSGEHTLTGSHRRHQKFMSYLTGWYAVLGWQTSLVGTALAPAQIFQAVVILYNPSFASKGMFSTSRNAVHGRS